MANKINKYSDVSDIESSWKKSSGGRNGSTHVRVPLGWHVTGRLLALETCVTLSRKGGYARILLDLCFVIGHQDIILEEKKTSSHRTSKLSIAWDGCLHETDSDLRNRC